MGGAFEAAFITYRRLIFSQTVCSSLLLWHVEVTFNYNADNFIMVLCTFFLWASIVDTGRIGGVFEGS